MAYGLQATPRALQGAQPVMSKQASAVSNHPWRSLDSDRRLALIEQSLADRGIRDGYPLAL